MLKLSMTEKKCNNILVRGVNWIGDAVMTLPALRTLKLSIPDSKIALLVKPWVSPLFEKNPYVSEIILYKNEYRGISGKFRLARMLKKEGFCMSVLFQNAFDAALITFLARIPERIGYSRDGRRMLLTKAVPFDNHARSLHHIEYYLNMLRKAGFDAEQSIPWIFLSLDERLEARDKLKELKRPVIAINPGATYGSSKRWPSERFAELTKRLIDEMKSSVVIFGGPAEIGVADEICKTLEEMKRGSQETGEMRTEKAHPSKFSSPKVLNMAGRTSLRELVSLISECDLLVTNDSGPMHIGYAVRTPAVALFGSTSPEHTGPVGNGNIVIRKDVDCAPCFERECRDRDLKCMDSISSREVFEAVKELVRPKRSVFFDRDGTLCKDVGYLNRREDLEIFPAVAGLSRLKGKGFSIIGVSNQSGIARGLVDKEFVKEVNSIFIDRYGFDGFYFCPHHPGEHCSCRKPEPGMLFDARDEHGINLRESFFVGDKDLDMLLAKSVGAKGVFVQTGPDNYSPNADFVVKDIEEAVNRILEIS
jgi:heptosyltransferase-2